MGAAGRPVEAVVLMAVHVTSIASLAAQLKMRGEMLDAFGPTDDGELMRLAAATLTEFEAMFNPKSEMLEFSMGDCATVRLLAKSAVVVPSGKTPPTHDAAALKLVDP